MAKKILFLAHVDESGNALPAVAYEVLGAAVAVADALGGTVTIGLIGEDVQAAAETLASTEFRIIGVSGEAFSHPRYATDSAAAEAICRAVSAEIVMAPATSRFLRAIPGVAQRLKGKVDTHIIAVDLVDGAITVKRWFYRQRLEAAIQRETRPWFLVMDSGCHEPWCGTAGKANVELIEVPLHASAIHTTYAGIRVPSSKAETIRPDAELLFVAGAGWCKKQADGKTHLPEAEAAILGFLKNSGASLGGSKSLVEQTGENQAVLGFMTHLNQVGQTGSTPRHPKGLSTCCHGEEPHVVGWRFINERRAINLDANCGWARGKADVLYVADAFRVLESLNRLLSQRVASLEEPVATATT